MGSTPTRATTKFQMDQATLNLCKDIERRIKLLIQSNNELRKTNTQLRNQIIELEQMKKPTQIWDRWFLPGVFILVSIACVAWVIWILYN